MDISQKEVNNIICITMNGRLDGQSAPDAEALIEDILKSDKLKLLFDCSGLEYISSAGLRVVLTAVKELSQKGGKVVLCCLTDTVNEVFTVSGFASIIPITDTVETGIKELS
jgi:anti-anti-sigma factor